MRIMEHTSRQPLTGPPSWAEKVPRWEQLDPAAGAIVEAWHAWDAPLPELFILANAAASNLADASFARSGATSPSRFVATLPSVAIVPLLQVTGWTGPMLCIQDGAKTLDTALDEAKLLLAAYDRIGVLTYDLGPVEPPYDRPRAVTVRYFDLLRGEP